ncbi:hypothetical protein GH714_040863 [Hevea brasiliensis]|uniref:Uncharacterized protein n=1 Tax=Hevea brasiliensis TaxID=3981 RepID=A0A6A6MUH0_HEVBR|nr:hypothetical protein GH714_040863 [Hevea brasiliensis]
MRCWNRASIPVKDKLTGRASESAVEVLPRIITQALRIARAWITDALEKRKKVRVKGSVKMDEEIVWESFRLRNLKNSDEGGNPAALKRFSKRLYIVGKRDVEDGTSASESIIETEKGKARKAAIEVKY